MIALDTNAVVRMLIEDDKKQAKAVEDLILFAEKNDYQLIVLSEVLIETIWVLETVYHCTKNEISKFLEALISTPSFTLPDAPVTYTAIQQYKKGGDFADLMIVAQARKNRAKYLFSFDKKLQKLFPDYIISNVDKIHL